LLGLSFPLFVVSLRAVVVTATLAPPLWRQRGEQSHVMEEDYLGLVPSQ